MKLILASESVYRKNLLERCGVSFLAHKPLLDEEKIKQEFSFLNPLRLSQELALKKAQSLEPLFPEDLLLGSDQLVDFEGEVLGKGGTFDGTLKILKRLNGHSYQLHTSVCLVIPQKKPLLWTVTAKVKMKNLTEKSLRDYLELDKPFDCAGGCKIEKAGPRIIHSIACSDPTAIEGLPMMDLLSHLSHLAVL